MVRSDRYLNDGIPGLVADNAASLRAVLECSPGLALPPRDVFPGVSS
jgi:hypothetical protein